MVTTEACPDATSTRSCRSYPSRSSPWTGGEPPAAELSKRSTAWATRTLFAAELATERGAWLVTADPEFAKVGKTLSVCSLSGYER